MRKWLSLSLIVAAMFAAGCSGGADAPQGGGGPLSVASPAPSDIPANVTAVATEAETRSLAGQTVVLRYTRQGLDTLDVPILYRQFEGTDQLLSCVGDVPVGPGDSGSPIIGNVNGEWKLLGALAYGINGNEVDFWAQPAYRMETYLDMGNPNPGEPVPAKYRSLTAFRLFAPPAIAQRLQRFASTSLSERGRSIRVVGRSANANVQARGASLRVVDDQRPVVGGQSIQIDLIAGPLLDGGAQGTITRATDTQLWIFGHDLFAFGPSNLPTSRAIAYGFVSEFGKLMEATTLPLGELTLDTFVGCGVSTVAQADTFTLTNTASLNGQNWQHEHQLAQSVMVPDLAASATMASLDSEFQYILSGRGRLTVSGMKGGQEFTNEGVVVEDDDLNFQAAFQAFLFLLDVDRNIQGPWQSLVIDVQEEPMGE